MKSLNKKLKSWPKKRNKLDLSSMQSTARADKSSKSNKLKMIKLKIATDASSKFQKRKTLPRRSK